MITHGVFSKLGIPFLALLIAVSSGCKFGKKGAETDSAFNNPPKKDYENVVPIVPPTAPTAIVLTNPASSPGNNSKPSFKVTFNGSPGVYVAIFTDSSCSNEIGSHISGNTETGVTATTALNPGTHTIYARSFDSNTQTPSPCSSASETYVLDTAAPIVSINSPAANSYVNASNVSAFVVSGTCSEEGRNVLISYSGTSTTATCSNLTWTKTLNLTSLANGNFSVMADHNDLAGNVAVQASRTFIKDVTAPTVAFTTPEPNTYINDANKSSFTMSGTCSENGRDVTVGFSTVTTVVTCNNGTFSTTFNASPVADGTIVATADLSDAAGNAATQSTRSIIKDTTAPNPPSTIGLSSPATSPGNDDTPTFTLGGLNSGDTIFLYSDQCSTQVASTTASGTTSLATSSSISSGTYTFYAKSRDPAGNTSTCSTANVIYNYDNSPPTVAITSPAANTYIYSGNKAAFTVSGTCSESGRNVTLTASSQTTTVTCNAGAWTKTFDFSNAGTYPDANPFAITADHTDASGNVATQANRNFIKDVVASNPPSGLALNTPTSSPGNISTPTITLSGVTSGDTIKLYSDACTTEVASGTASGVTVNLTSSAISEGTYTYYAKAIDPAGNISSCSTATVAYEYDNTPPTVAITSPAVNSYIYSGNKAAFTVSGTCSEENRNVTITASGQTFTATCTTGAWTKTLDLSSAATYPDSTTYTIYADHTDVSGNNAIQASRVFYKDTVAPTTPSGIALQSPATSPGNDSTPTVRVSGVTNGHSISIYTDNTCSIPALKATATSAGATVDVTSLSLNEGTYTYYATATDPAGNTSSCSTASVDYEYDATVPTVAITSPAANSYVNNASKAAFTISGTCTENARTVTVVFGSVTGTPTCTLGVWSTTLNVTAVADATVTVTADHSDAAGNAAVQATRDFIKDIVAPTTPSALALNSPASSPGSDTTPSIQVSGVANGLSVKLYTNNSCTTQTGSTGSATGATINIDSSVLADASTTDFYATATDAAGNESTCSTATVQYVTDTSPPTVAITSPAANTYIYSGNKAAFTVSGTCSENTRNVTVTAAGQTSTATCTANAWTKTLDLSNSGTYPDANPFTITADHSDAAGNTATQATRDFIKDTVAPSVPSGLALSSPATSPGSDTTPTIQISGVANGLSVKMFTNNTCSTQTGSTGSATGATINIDSSTLADASTTDFYATATDAAGNESACSTATVQYVTDTSPPTVAITSPAANSYIYSGNKTAFTVSGTCSENTRNVTITAAGQTSTATCTANAWTKTLNLSNAGTYPDANPFTITADHDDAAGNSATTASRDFIKDVVAPSAPSGLALNSPATSPGSDTTPTIQISGVANGLSVKLYTNNSCTTQTGSTGSATGATINIDSSALADASTTNFYATATDAAGNESTCSAATVQYVTDTSPPTVAITSPAANSYIYSGNKAAFTVSGTCSENTRNVTITAAGVSVTATCTANAWSKALDLSNSGTYADANPFTITADHSDAAGNTATQATRDFIKDTVAPSAPSALALSSPATSPGSDTTPTIQISGVANGLSVKMFTNNSCSTQTGSTGSATGATINIDSSALADGSTTDFYATATDAAGNESTCSAATVQYIADTSPPTVAITSPAANSYIYSGNKAAFTVSGTCSEETRNVTVTAAGQTSTATCTAGAWTKTLDLSNSGTYADANPFTITADHSDSAGNAATQATRNFIKDTVVPSAPSGLALSSPATSPGSDTTPTIQISGVANGLSVKMFTNNTCSTQTGSTGSATGATINIDSSTLADGSTTDFYATATDAAGNESSCSTATVQYVADTSNPTVAITSPAANSYIYSGNKAAFTVSGTCSENTRNVTITVAGQTSTATCTANAWTKTLDLSNAGTYADANPFTITADHSDAAGNNATQATRNFIKDVVAPSAPTAVALSNPGSTPGIVSTPSFLISGVTSGHTISIYSDNTCSTPALKGSTTAAAATATVTSSALNEASYTMYSTATDPAGNVSACSTASAAYTYDVSIPTVAITSPAANSYIYNGNKAAFTVSGTCTEEGRDVTITASGQTSTASCTAGAWTKTLDLSNSGTYPDNSTYAITADHTDAASNAAVQASRNFNKDTVAPTTPSAVALQSPATSPNTDTTPTIRVSGVSSGLSVKLFTNNTCTTQTGSTGSATGATIDIDSSVLADGSTTDFYATATDAAGNESSCSTATAQYVTDTSAPTVAITSPAANSYIYSGNKAAFTVSGTCSENGRNVTITASGQAVTATCTTGTWSKALDLSNSGTYADANPFTITADHSDAAGNAAVQDSRNFIKDTVAPSAPTGLALNSPATSPGSDTTPTIQVSGVANGLSVKMYTNNTCSVQAGSTGSATGATINIDSSALADGSTTDFYATSTDAAGNESTCSTATVQYVVDTSNPTVAITSPAANSYIYSGNKAAFTVSGTCSENTRNVTITAAGQTTTATCTANAWTKTLDLSNSGTYADANPFTITADHSDSAGNNATQATRDFIKDTVAPTTPSSLALFSPATSPGSDTTPTITISGVTNGLSVKMFTDNSCSTQTGSTGSATGATINIDSSALADGSTTNFYANATDAAGNTSTCSTATVQYVTDTSNPTVAITSPAANSYIYSGNKAAFTVSGTCSENTRNVTVTAAGQTTTATCTAGAWTKTLDLSNAGTYADANPFTITADHSDASGNNATQATRDFIKDTVAPSAPSALALNSPATSPGNDTTPTIQISGVSNGLSVKMFTDNACTSQTGSTGSATGATINIDSGALADGSTTTFYANATDAAGNVSDCSTANVQYVTDTSNPTVAITSPAANSYIYSGNKAAFTISGTCSENTRNVTITAAGQTATATCTANAWTKTLDLSNAGTYADANPFTITADHSDASGNNATQATRDFIKDTVAPSEPSGLALSSPATSPGSDTTPTIQVSGVANGLSVKMFTDNSCSTQTGSTGSATGATINIDSSALSDGSTTDFYANAIDAAGNVSSCSTATVQYVTDTSNPTVAITSPAANSYINSANKAAFTVSGTCSENTRNVTITAAGQSTTATCTANAWTKTLDLSNAGTYADANPFTITADHSDASGNNATQATRDFIKDTVAPSVPSGLALQSPASSPGADDTPTITVSGVANGVTATLYSDNTCSIPALKGTGNATGATVNVTSSALNAGTYTFYATATDAASNESACSTANVAYEYNNSVPTVAITSPNANSYIYNGNKAAFTVSGTCSENTRNVTITVAGQTSTATCTGGAWTKTLDLSNSGTYADANPFTITADHTNAAGTPATQATRDFIKDTVAPSAPSALALSSPATSPGSDTTPTIQVSGVANGYSVKMFTDNTCSTQTGSTGSATGATINIDSSALSDGSTTDFYATALDAAGNESSCSTATVQYVTDTSNPTVAITAPAANSYIYSGNKAAFTVSGTCSENGRNVTVTVSGQTSTTACGAGVWSKTLDLSNSGTYADANPFTITADHSDASGNNATQATRDFIKDTVAPSAPSGLALSSPASSPGSDTTPTIQVSGVANGLSVKMFTDNTCSTQTGSTGSATGATINIDSSTLSDGSTTDFYANATDAAGNTSSCSTATVQYVTDTSNPTVAITSPAANSYIYSGNKAAFTVSGTCSENTRNVTVTAAGQTSTATCTANAWTKTLDLSNAGTYADASPFTITADHSDSSGNNATQATRDFIKDTVAPTTPSGLALSSPATSPGSDTTPTIQVSGVANGLTVKLFTDNSCSTQTGSDGSASGVTINLDSGTLANASTTDFYATATDAAGNESTCSTATVQYVVDTSNPTVAITSPAANSYIYSGNKSAFTVSGTCSENTRNVTITASGQSVTATCTAGTWTKTLDLSNSGTYADANPYAITADHSDSAGNNATQASRDFIKDTVAPTTPSGLALNTPATSPNSDTTPTIQISGVANGLSVKMFTDNTCSTQTGSTGSATGATINIDSSALSNGSTTNFYATATDAAGNVSDCSTATVQYVTDTSNPTIAITSPAANSYIYSGNKAAFTVSGTCSEEGRTVTVTANSQTASATCSSGTWSKALDLSNATTYPDANPFTITADISDAAGNNATQATRDFIKDVVAPSAPSGLALSSPATSPNSDTTPTIQISGVANGLSVKMFTDNSCSTQTGSTGSATGATINIDSSTLSNGSTTDFYANATDAAGNTSTCSTATVQYVTDTSAPTIAITSPAANSYIYSGNKAAFTVSGTCSEEGRTVTVTANSQTATTTCSSGTWSKALDLSNATTYPDANPFTITADISDAAGNNATQATRDFIKDVVAPSAPSGLALNDPASSPGTDSTPTITVSGVANGLTVTLYSDACTTQVSSGSATGATINLTSSALAEAAYTMYAKATDAAGNASSCSTANVAYTYQTIAPVVAITAPAANSYIYSSNKSAFTVSGTCTIDGTNNITITASGQTSTANCSSGTWSKTLDLSNATTYPDANPFTITADLSGATQATRDFIKDVVAPTAPSGLSLNSPASSPGNSATPSITVSGVANGYSVTIYTSNTCAIPALKGTATSSGATVNVSSDAVTDGATNTFYAAATDAAGNISSCSTANVVYVYDGGVPTVTITSPAANSYINIANKAAFTIGGSCSENGRNVTITVNGQTSTVACASVSWSKTLDLSNATTYPDADPFTITADHSDSAGNNATQASRNFKKDTVAPSAPSGLALNDPATSPGTDSTPTITISGVVSGLTVGMYSNNTCTTSKGSGTASATTINITSSALSEGTYSFYSKATDAAGNASSCSTATVAYVLDNSAPVINSLSLADFDTGDTSITNTGNVYLNADVADSSTIEMCVDDNSCTSCSYEAYNSQSNHTLDTGSLGTKTLYAKFRDATGNESACSSASIIYEEISIKFASSFGSNLWNDYYLKDDPTRQCNYADDDKITNCIQNGTSLTVTTQEATCDHHNTITDSLDIFDWSSCSEDTGVAVYTSKLKNGKHLSDFIDFAHTTFNPLSVTFDIGGSSTKNSYERIIYGETVAELPDSSSSVPNLEGNTVYTISSGMSAQMGYTISSPSTSIVAQSGKLLVAAEDPNTYNNGLISTAANAIWIEGNFRGAQLIDHATLTYEPGLISIGIGSHFVTVDNSVIEKSSNRGIHLSSGAAITVKNSTIAQNYSEGIYVNKVAGSVLFDHLKVYQNGQDGISLPDSGDVTISDVLTVANSKSGLVIGGAQASVFVNRLLATFNGATGISSISDSDQIRSFSNIVSANNDSASIYINASSGQVYTVFSNTVVGYSTHLADKEIMTAGSDRAMAFENNLVFKGSQSCNDPNAQPCSDSIASTANIVTNRNFTGSFGGHITTDDTANSSDTLGTTSYTSELDNFGFENFYRFWVKRGFTSFPSTDPTYFGLPVADDAIDIWDFTATTGDAKLKNRTGNVTSENEAFTENAECPTQVSGNEISDTLNSSLGIKALKYATEITGDLIGDDNGLCTDGEACLYNPNFGPYQGEGALKQCTFSDGTITGVKMYAFETNTGVVGTGGSGGDATFEQISNTYPGDSDAPYEMTAYNSNLYFVAANSSGYNKLYKYDGSSVTQISDINSSSGDSINDLTVFGTDLYFVASSDGSEMRLYKYDGTNITQPINTNTGGNDNTNSLIVYNSKLYFSSTNSSQKTKLFSYDGTTLTQVSDTNTGRNDTPQSFTINNGKLYFMAAINASYEYKIFSYDGTTITQISDTHSHGSDNSQYLISMGGSLYFSSLIDASNYKLFKYDGTSVTQITNTRDGGNDNTGELTSTGSKLYFRSDTSDNVNKLYEYDGSTLTQVSDINSGGTDAIANISAVGTTIYFEAYDNNSHIKLYKYDGDTVTQVSDTNHGGDDYPQKAVVVGTDVFFIAFEDATFKSIYKYNGTTVTKVLERINPNGHKPALSIVDGVLYVDSEHEGNVKLYKYVP